MNVIRISVMRDTRTGVECSTSITERDRGSARERSVGRWEIKFRARARGPLLVWADNIEVVGKKRKDATKNVYGCGFIRKQQHCRVRKRSRERERGDEMQLSTMALSTTMHDKVREKEGQWPESGKLKRKQERMWGRCAAAEFVTHETPWSGDHRHRRDDLEQDMVCRAHEAVEDCPMTFVDG